MAYYEEEFEYIDNVQPVRLVEHNALGTALRVERRFCSSHCALPTACLPGATA